MAGGALLRCSAGERGIAAGSSYSVVMTGRELCAEAAPRAQAELARDRHPGERNPQSASQLRPGLPGHGGTVIASLADHRPGANDVSVNGASDQLPVLAMASGPANIAIRRSAKVIPVRRGNSRTPADLPAWRHRYRGAPPCESTHSGPSLSRHDRATRRHFKIASGRQANF
jgi:hypothetical protein